SRCNAVAGHRPFVPPEPPRTPKAQQTRRRLLDLAATMFVERGFSAVSIRDIAAAAELTNGAVYGHFRTKGQLLVEALRWKVAQRDSEVDLVDAASDPIHGVGLMFGEDGRELRMLEVDAAAAARHDPDVAAGMAELYAERHERIRDAASDLPDPDTAAW